MGFRKDHPLHWQHENRMIHGSRNSDQEYYMFQTRGIPAYTCRNTFVYHDKSGSADPRIRCERVALGVPWVGGCVNVGCA